MSAKIDAGENRDELCKSCGAANHGQRTETMREAEDQHGEQHWRAKHLLHEDDHALEQRIELRSIGAAKNASKVLVRVVSVGILVVRVDSSVVHL